MKQTIPDDLDEFYDLQEKFASLEPCGDELRLGKVKASISDDFTEGDLEIWKKPDGSVEIKVTGYHEIETEEKEKCDLGHFHKVKQNRLWVYETTRLSKKQRIALAKWLVS